MSRQDRPNVFLDVTPKEPEPLPPQEEILDMQQLKEDLPPPTEKEIFKQPSKKDLVLSKPEGVKRKADRKTDQKRQVTPKMKAHLDRIRHKAVEGKKKKAAERAGVEYVPSPALNQVQEDPLPPPQVLKQPSLAPQLPSIPESVPQSVNYPQFDYDQLADRLWSKQQKYNDEQKYISTITEKIRQEEREKALKESTILLKEAASKYKKDHQAQLGRSVLQNYQNRYAGHPVFKVRQDNQGKFQASSTNSNPFDVCFK